MYVLSLFILIRFECVCVCVCVCVSESKRDKIRILEKPPRNTVIVLIQNYNVY